MSKFIKILLLIIVFAGGSEVSSQPITWEKINYNIYSNSFYCVQQLSDGNFIVAGISRISSYYKMYVVKYNNLGDTVFSKSYDTNVMDTYDAKWIEETYDKGLIIAGSGPGPNGDAYLVKMDSIGTVVWFRSYGGNNLDQGYCVKETPDKGYILLSRTTSFSSTEDIMVTKTDSLGSIKWQKIIDTGTEDFPSELDLVNNSGYIVTGQSVGYSNLIRLDLNGDTLWHRKFTTIGINSVQTLSNGFILGGESGGNGIYNSSIMKTDSLGNQIWQRSYNTLGFEDISRVRERKNKNGFVFCGWADTAFIGDYNIAMFKITDTNGVVISQKFFSPYTRYNRFNSLSNTDDNGFIFAGNTVMEFGVSSGYLVKTDSLGNIKVGIHQNGIEIPEGFTVEQNYPNPFNPSTTILYEIPKNEFVKIKVFDITGRELLTLVNELQHPGSYKVTFDGQNFASGIYFYKIEAGDFTETRRMVLIR
jgi:Secretion system C-terminal sorting domain